MHECALNHCDETKDEVLQGMSPVTMRTAEMAIHMRCPAENIYSLSSLGFLVRKDAGPVSRCLLPPL